MQSLFVVQRRGSGYATARPRISTRAEQSLAHRFRETSPKHDIPERAGNAIASTDPLRTVVIEMILLDVAEVAVIEVVVVL